MLTHRWLGVALGLLVLAWCLSGVVMMYVAYPALEDHERRVALKPMHVSDLVDILGVNSGLANLSVDEVVAERWGSTIVLRARLSSGEVLLVDLSTGLEIKSLAREDLVSFGLQIGTALGFSTGRYVADIEIDQWTVHGRFNRHRPMLLFEGDRKTQWYVSSQTGEFVQMTDEPERFWNWLGSVVHWLYPTLLRKDTELWAQVVILLTVFALFLTSTGIAFGIKQYRWSADRRRSPYMGWSKWHHYSGLLFGLLILTWLSSGLISMNPWGVLESRSFAAERGQLLGHPVALSELLQSARSVLADKSGIADRVRMRRSAFGIQVTAIDPAGQIIGYSSETLSPKAEVIARIARPHTQLEKVELLTAGDSYYYDHHNRNHFPVHRAVYADSERFYFHPVTGELLLAVDAQRAWYRWFFNALHSGDFHRIVRVRPTWDVWMILLITGLVAGSATGVVLAWKRVRRRQRIDAGNA